MTYDFNREELENEMNEQETLKDHLGEIFGLAGAALIGGLAGALIEKKRNKRRYDPDIVYDIDPRYW